jgi:hypothetical protein
MVANNANQLVTYQVRLTDKGRMLIEAWFSGSREEVKKGRWRRGRERVMDDHEVSVEQEIADTSMGRPHVLLLGAGASKAALPHGDKKGVAVPLLRDVAETLGLSELFPEDLRQLAKDDFEAAYSRLYERDTSKVTEIDSRVADYFSALELPDEANLYDFIHLCLREKDAIFTFNWDPFLMQSRTRLAKLGVTKFPMLFFLHGNVTVGYCAKDNISGVVGQACGTCGEPFEPSKLLFPVEKKDYQDDPFIAREWEAVREYLKACFMLTMFGYSAPTTDVEAIDLLKAGWGKPSERNMEQTEIINRPDADQDELRQKWRPFIHTHHYEVHGSFYDSWLGNHPRRSGEAYWNQYWEAKFIDNHPVPRDTTNLSELVEWFKPLLDVEATV